MSEVSESYHIRTLDPNATMAALRKARLSGVLFGPGNGWLTFVPYEDLKAYRDGASFEAFTRQLSRILNATVLHYSYAEDYGWTFGLVLSDGILSRFACWWYPEPNVERDEYDPEAFSSLGPIEALEPIVQQVDVGGSLNGGQAYRFAELMGLPAFKWISPRLAQHHTDDLTRMGGRKLGTKPPSAAEELHVPSARKLTLARPDLSAREALGAIHPFASILGPEWNLYGVSGTNRLLKNP